MRRFVLSVVAISVVILGTYAVWAQQQNRPGRMGMMPGQMGMMGGHGGMCAMHNCMMGGMMQRSMVALEGGGVCVLVGNQLMKFDSNLEMEHRIELPVDWEKLQEQMKGMMQNCPMCRQQMGNTPNQNM